MEEQHVAGGNLASSTRDAQQLPRYLSNAQKMQKKSRFVDFLREARRILGGLLLQVPIIRPASATRVPGAPHECT